MHRVFSLQGVANNGNNGSGRDPRRKNPTDENDRLKQRLDQTGESKYFDSNRARELLGGLERREAQVTCLLRFLAMGVGCYFILFAVYG